MPDTFGSRVKNAWNAFMSRDRPNENYGYGFARKPDRVRLSLGTERSIVAALYNRIAIDVSSIDIRHVRVDENDKYVDTIRSPLNKCLTLSANLDQISKAFIQDAVLTMFDEGCVAIVPVVTSQNPNRTGSYDIYSLRAGRVVEWYPQHVKIDVYDERTGQHAQIIMRKDAVAIVENPLYAVMNEPNSTLRRLIRKINLLDGVDEQVSSGKLDILIQLPYATRSAAKQKQAEQRRRLIEEQLTGSKYGIAYIDGTERVTQLNRPAENNLLNQIEYQTKLLFNQLGITEGVFYGEANEQESLNYHNRTIAVILDAFTQAMTRSFLSTTAYTQGQRVQYFRDPFKLVPVAQVAEMSDKLTRNEIYSPNEIRGILGSKPSDDPKANELRNRNINAGGDGSGGLSLPVMTENGQNGNKGKMSGDPLAGLFATKVSDLDSLEQSDIEHSGVKGMKWGVKNGPPYPLDQDTARIKSLEKKLGTAYSLNDEVLSRYKNQYRNLSHVRTGPNSLGKLFVKNGKVTAMVNTDLTKDGERQIQGIELFGEAKGRGYSRELLDYAVKDLGAKELSVRKSNSIAKHLYDGYGFKTYRENDYMYFMKLDEKR